MSAFAHTDRIAARSCDRSNAHPGPRARLSQALRTAPTRLARLARRWIKRRIAIYELRRDLQAMPDVVLRDVGLRREEIRSRVEEHIDPDGRRFGGYPFSR